MSRERELRNISLLVRNLPLDTRAEEVRAKFEKYGRVRDVYLPRDYYSGRPKGFGFVAFVDPRDAEDAMYALDRTMFGGREITVCQSKESRKTPREMSVRDERMGIGPRTGGNRRRSPSPRRRRSYSRSRSRDRRRRSYSRSRSRDRRRRSYSRSHSRERRRSLSRSHSRSPPPRRSRSRSRSPAAARSRSRSRSPAVARPRSRSLSRSPARSKSPAKSLSRSPPRDLSPRDKSPAKEEDAA